MKTLISNLPSAVAAEGPHLSGPGGTIFVVVVIVVLMSIGAAVLLTRGRGK